MRTLVEQFKKVSESEKRKIYDLQNESTETEIYGEELMNFCKKELFEKKQNQPIWIETHLLVEHPVASAVQNVSVFRFMYQIE